jgi:hypothetical protein
MCSMKRATPASRSSVTFPTLVDFGCMLRLISDWVSENSNESAVRSAANVLHALDSALRLDRLGPVFAVQDHPPRTLLVHLEHAASEVLRSQAVKDAATADEILAVSKRRVQVMQQMLDATFSPPAASFEQLRDRSVSFIDMLLAQGSRLPESGAGVIAKAVLGQLKTCRFEVPRIEECDALRERLTKKIAPLVESSTGRGRKLRRDGAADVFDAAMRVLGLGDLGKATAAVAGSGSAKSPARAPDRPRARRPRRGL